MDSENHRSLLPHTDNPSAANLPRPYSLSPACSQPGSDKVTVVGNGPNSLCLVEPRQRGPLVTYPVRGTQLRIEIGIFESIS